VQNSMLADWLETPKGAYALGGAKAVRRRVEDVFGYRRVQVGLRSGLSARVAYPAQSGSDWSRAAACVRSGSVAPRPQSIDLIALPHVLEFCPRRMRSARAERVLMPRAAWSSPASIRCRCGARRARWLGRRRYPGCGVHRAAAPQGLAGAARLRVNGGRFGCYAPPFNQGRWLERFGLWKRRRALVAICGSVYVVRAVKRVAACGCDAELARQAHAQEALAPVTQRETGCMSRSASGAEGGSDLRRRRCKGNPARAGRDPQRRRTEKEIFGGEPHTTNNRMELTAGSGRWKRSSTPAP